MFGYFINRPASSANPHTQAAYLPANQVYGDLLMKRGRTCKEVVDSLLTKKSFISPGRIFQKVFISIG